MVGRKGLLGCKVEEVRRMDKPLAGLSPFFLA